ncbi:peptidoglycan-binding protein, partial [Streptomyces olivaceoviridis]|uniref:peptidoglycan-binding protein n=1 Tax=Streptomyces olivaceoviridis TaxID=1921 RepID=UPI001677906B
MPQTRGKQVTVVIAAVVVVGAGGWFAGTGMQSPADAAAAHKPPKAGPVTVPVAHRKLTATVVAQGTVAFGAPQPVLPAGAVATTGPSSDAPAAQLVTRAPKQGATLHEGSVLMQISGRPVFVLSGSVPMYRTLTPGISGDDVRQLQMALRRLGHDPGGVNGHFGPGTATAVAKWYESKGYEPQTPSAQDDKERGDLEEAVTQAQLALLQAQGGQGASGDASAAPASDAEHSLRLKSARDQLNRANRALSEFLSSYGTKVPAGEVVFLPNLPVRVDKVTARVGTAPDGPVATVTSSDIEVHAEMPAADAAQLHQGMAARVETPDGHQAAGVVTRIGTSAQGDTGSGSDSADASATVPVTVSVPEPGALRGQAGGSAKITMGLRSSKGTALVVPVAAVHTTADGRARVRVQRDGKIVDVPVTVGLSAAGQV